MGSEKLKNWKWTQTQISKMNEMLLLTFKYSVMDISIMVAYPGV